MIDVPAPFKAWCYAHSALLRKRLTLPDFLGIGTPQSGTTWLWQNLACHPDIFLARPKELYFFDRHFADGLPSYAHRFKGGRTQTKGEITPSYSTLTSERIAFIRHVMPDVRLVLIMRNPIDRAWSAARRVFSDEARDRGIPFEEIPVDEFLNFCRIDDAYKMVERGVNGDYVPGLKRADYPTIIRNWHKHFPEKQLLLTLFDDIVDRPRELLTEVFNHLGVSTDIDWGEMPMRQNRWANPQASMPAEVRALLEEIYRPGIEELRKQLGDRIHKW